MVVRSFGVDKLKLAPYVVFERKLQKLTFRIPVSRYRSHSHIVTNNFAKAMIPAWWPKQPCRKDRLPFQFEGLRRPLGGFGPQAQA